MATFTQVRDLILGDIHRNDLTTQVETALGNAVTKLRMDRFWFNETQASFTASATSDYDLATVLPTILTIDQARVWHNGHPTPLDRVDWEQVNWIDEGLGTGTPSCWAVHHQLLRIYPTPSETMSVEVVGLRELSATAWCSYAPTLMRSMAQVEIYTLVLHDEAAAMRAAAYAQGERAALIRRPATAASNGQIKPYL